jgi:hypothetical protein
MQQAIDWAELARGKRDLARRARRLAQSQMSEEVRARLSGFADELEREADSFEKRRLAPVEGSPKFGDDASHR